MTTHSVGEACTEALVQFERVIALEVEGLKAGIYTVDVNGVIDRFELERDNVIP
jgi:inhibitor of cysteine peptidase